MDRRVATTLTGVWFLIASIGAQAAIFGGHQAGFETKYFVPQADAEGIARAHFAAGGQTRVAALQAFAILAYQPTGKGFYPTRVLYLSFHRNSDAPPEYVAWVDLTQRRVLRSRQEGQ